MKLISQDSVNAGKMDCKDQPIKDDFVRGFFSFDPYASVQDQHDPFLCLAVSVSPPGNPFLFFLTFAFNMLIRESELNKEGSAFFNIFPSIKDFAAFYSSLTTVFGELVDSEDGAFYAGDARFVLFQIPKSYPIQVARLNPSVLVKLSIMCLLFMFDICSAIGTHTDLFKWKSKGSVKMKPVGTASYIYAIPESFQIGFFEEQV